MAKQKRLNTNLVVFLTVMGMVVTVSLAGLIVWQGAQRDPEALARSAREFRTAGNLPEAAKFFQRAYVASKEKTREYLLDAAQCWLDLGEIGGWQTLLRQAHVNEPRERVWLEALLNGMWQVQEISVGGLGTNWSQRRRDDANELLEIDPNSVLALVSKAHALWNLRGEDDIREGDKAAEQAYALAPNDPRVALTRLAERERQFAEQDHAARAAEAPEADIARLRKAWAEERVTLLEPAVAAHPDDVALVSQYATILGSRATALARYGESEPAHTLLAQATEVVAGALKANADAPDLLMAQSELLAAHFDIDHDTLSADEQRQLLSQVDACAARALQAEPATWKAYVQRARVQLLNRGTGNDDARTTAARYDGALAVLEQAAQETVSLWKTNVRARLTDASRLRLLRYGFSLALEYLDTMQDAEARTKIIARAEGFLNDAQTKYPDRPETLYMQAQLAVARDDLLEGIKSYEAAEKRAQSLLSLSGQYWRQAGVERLPNDQLAELYLKTGQVGAARQCAAQAIVQYEQHLGEFPPLSLVLLNADVLMRLDKAKDALDVLNKYRAAYSDQSGFNAARAMVLSGLGQNEAAGQAAARVGTADASAQAQQFRIAMARRDYAGAEQALQAMIDAPNASPEARAYAQTRLPNVHLEQARQALADADYAAAEKQARDLLADTTLTDEQWGRALALFASTMNAPERREAGRAYLEQLVKNPPRAQLTRLVRQYVVMLSEEDPQRRDAQLLDMIKEQTDPVARAEEYYRFYVGRNQDQKAVEYLVQLHKLAPDNIAYVEEEFGLRLKLKDFERAAELLLDLSRYDDGQGLDHAGGATYRGRLALERGDYDVAIREFQAALRELPKSAELEVSLAQAYLVSRRLSEGTEALQHALEINPQSLEAHVLLLRAYEQLAAQSFGPEAADYEAKMANELAQAEKLAPQHPVVQAERQRFKERQAPAEAIAQYRARWQSDPDDADNVLHLAQLYARVAAAATDRSAPAVAPVLKEGEAFLQAAVPHLSAEQQLRAAPNVIAFYATGGDTLTGESLLRGVIEAQADSDKIRAQLLLARFFDTTGSLDAAERSYQAAQRMAQELQDAKQQLAMERQVAAAFIDHYKRRGLSMRVIEVCRWMLDRLGNDAAAAQGFRAQLIEALLGTGRLADAETEINTYIGLYGQDDLTGLLARAQLRGIQNDRAGAKADLDRILTLVPTHAWAHYQRGNLALQRGDYPAAKTDLEEARDLVRDPQMLLRVHDRLASLYTRMDKLDLAERELRDKLAAVEEHGQPAERQAAVADLVRLLYDRAQQFERAKQVISEYMERFPGESAWPFEMGRLFEAKAQTDESQARRAATRSDTRREQEYTTSARQSYAAAVPYYARAMEKCGPNDQRVFELAMVARLRALTKANLANEAVALFGEYAKQQRPSPSARMEAAKAFGEIGQADAARDQWKAAALEASQISGMAGASVVRELRATLGDETTETLLQQLLSAAPEASALAVRLRLLLAGHYLAAGAAQKALPILESVLADARPGSVERREALMVRAQAQEKTGDRAASLATYRAVLEMDPGNLIAMNNLAYSLVEATGDLARPQEAKAYADKLWRGAATLADSSVVLDTVGYVYFKCGELETAAAALEESLSVDDTSNPVTYLHLGQVYAAQDRRTEARTMLKHGLELAQSSDDPDTLALVPQFEAELQKVP